MKIFSQKKRYSLAFTLAETVVAMSIILLISASAISAMAYSNTLSRRNDSKLFFATEIDNYLSCYIGDNFSTADTSLLSFYLGAPSEPFAEKNVATGEYKFYYAGNFTILPKTELEKSRYYISVKIVAGRGFFAEAFTYENTSVYKMNDFFKRADDYKGGA